MVLKMKHSIFQKYILFWQAGKFIAYERIDFLCLKCLAIRFHIMQNRVNKLGRTLNWTFPLLPCVTIVYVCLSHTLESTSLDIPCDCLCIESGINFSCVHHFHQKLLYLLKLFCICKWLFAYLYYGIKLFWNGLTVYQVIYCNLL